MTDVCVYKVCNTLFHIYFSELHTHQISSCLRLWNPKETSAALSDQVVCLNKITFLGCSLSLAVMYSEQIYIGSFAVEPTAFHMLHDYSICQICPQSIEEWITHGFRHKCLEKGTDVLIYIHFNCSYIIYIDKNNKGKLGLLSKVSSLNVKQLTFPLWT